MFSEKDIEGIYSSAFSDFSKKYKINCSFRLVGENEFMEVAKRSKLIKKSLKEGIPVLVGALVEHSNRGDFVYLSVDILNQITDKKQFVKALIMHEFYHVLFKDRVKKDEVSEDLNSELRAKKAMEKDFPRLSKYIV